MTCLFLPTSYLNRIDDLPGWTSGSSGRSNEAGHQAPTRNVALEGRISSSTSRPSTLMNGPPPGFERSTQTPLPGFGVAGRNIHALASGPSPPQLLHHRRMPGSNFADRQEANFVILSGEIEWTMILLRYDKGQAKIETLCERIEISKASFKNWMN
ncbi:hypothetical protein ACFE04_009998 [Oxalis oulophora]